jgi:hypothetical protein
MNADGTRIKRLQQLAIVSFLAIAIFIEVASIVQSIWQDSWVPMYTTGWLPVVVLASYRRTRNEACWPLRRRAS